MRPARLYANAGALLLALHVLMLCNAHAAGTGAHDHSGHPSQARQAVAGQHPVRFTAPTVRHNMLAGCIVVLAGLLLLTLAAGGTATPQALLVPPERRPAPARRPRAPPVIALCVLRH